MCRCQRSKLTKIKISFFRRFSRSMSANTKTKTNEQWRGLLSAEQFRVLRQKGTEAPFSGLYNKTADSGVYSCAGCDTPLYDSTSKFSSSCGWPAFNSNIIGTVTEVADNDHGMRRIEITCTACGGHLGHVFKGESSANSIRHCVNSVSINFTPK